MHNLVFRVVKVACNRWLFRFAPSLKERLQSLNGQLRSRDAVWQAPWAELHEMFRVAAVEERGALRICDLVNKGAVFDSCFTNARVLAAVGHVIAADFKLSSLNYRAAEPGGGLQPLHIDWFEARHVGQVESCNTLWLLDDLTIQNGATRVIPGSHLQQQSPAAAVEDPWQAHPDETYIVAKAGSVAIINGQLWHGGTMNRSRTRRRIIQSYFVGRGVKPQVDQKTYITQDTLERLSQNARAILGV